MCARAQASKRAVPAKPRRKFLIYFAFHLVMDSVHMKYDVPWVFFSLLFIVLCCFSHFYVYVFVFLHHGWCVYVIIIMSFFSLPSLSITFFASIKTFSLRKEKKRAHTFFLRSIQRTINDHFTLTYLLLNMIVVKRKLNIQHTHRGRDR